MTRKKKIVLSVLGSFGVYMLPIITHHFTLIWGFAIVAGSLRSHRDMLWKIAELVLAGGLQIAAFAMIYWLLSGRPWRWLLLIASSPVFFMVLNWTYLVALPQQFLIENISASEHGDWPIHCRLEGWQILRATQPVTIDPDPLGGVWITDYANEPQTTVMQGLDCEVARWRLPRPGTGGTPSHLGGGGQAIFRSFEDNSTSYWHVSGPAKRWWRLDLPAENDRLGFAISGRGDSIAWLERIEGSHDSRHLIVRSLATASEKRLRLEGLERRSATLIGLAGMEGPYFLSLYPGEIRRFDSNGREIKPAIRPQGIDHTSPLFLWLDPGWAAWEIYRDEGRTRLVWDLPAGKGSKEIPKGSAIQHVAVSPDGRLLAIGTGSNVTIGTTPDSLFVFQARDGREVYRRYFKKYSRNAFAFLSPRHFAIDHFDGETRRAWIEVLRVSLPIPTNSDEPTSRVDPNTEGRLDHGPQSWHPDAG